MAGSIFVQMNQQTRTTMPRPAATASELIQAGIDQHTNDRRADDVVDEIERIGDQAERSQIRKRSVRR